MFGEAHGRELEQVATTKELHSGYIQRRHHHQKSVVPTWYLQGARIDIFRRQQDRGVVMTWRAREERCEGGGLLYTLIYWDINVET